MGKIVALNPEHGMLTAEDLDALEAFMYPEMLDSLFRFSPDRVTRILAKQILKYQNQPIPPEFERKVLDSGPLVG